MTYQIDLKERLIRTQCTGHVTLAEAGVELMISVPDTSAAVSTAVAAEASDDALMVQPLIRPCPRQTAGEAAQRLRQLTRTSEN